MNIPKIKDFIVDLKATTEYEKAYVGIFKFVEDEDDGFVVGTTEGLKLFAAELLEASLELEKLPQEQKEKVTFNLNQGRNFLDKESVVFIHSVDLVVHKPLKINDNKQNNFQNRFSTVGCVLLLILAFIFSIVGFITIINWLF